MCAIVHTGCFSESHKTWHSNPYYFIAVCSGAPEPQRWGSPEQMTAFRAHAPSICVWGPSNGCLVVVGCCENDLDSWDQALHHTTHFDLFKKNLGSSHVHWRGPLHTDRAQLHKLTIWATQQTYYRGYSANGRCLQFRKWSVCITAQMVSLPNCENGQCKWWNCWSHLKTSKCKILHFKLGEKTQLLGLKFQHQWFSLWKSLSPFLSPLRH